VLIIAGSVMLLLVCALLAVHWGRSTIQVLAKKLRELSRTKDRMHDLIETLSAEEQRTRLTMSVMPLAVCLFDAEGRMIFANESFQSAFHFAEQDAQAAKIHVGKLLPQIDFKPLFERRPKRFVVPTTSVLSAFQVEEQYAVSVTFLDSRQRQSPVRGAMRAISTGGSGSNNGNGGSNANVKQTFDADFVVIIDTRSGLTDTTASEGSSRRTSESEPTARFANAAADDRMFESLFTHDTALMASFAEFCNREHAGEGLLFWRAVSEYRRVADVFGRVQRQRNIVDQFLAGHDKSKNPLNLPGGQGTEREMDKVRKMLGQAEVFDGLLALVMHDLRHDVFERFLAKNRHRSTMEGAAAVARDNGNTGGADGAATTAAVAAVAAAAAAGATGGGAHQHNSNSKHELDVELEPGDHQLPDL
jgi:Regulator of G protein signaling domain